MEPQELKNWRTAQGLTQQGLADWLRVTTRAIKNWEAGARAIPAFLPLALETIRREMASGKAAEAFWEGS